VPPPPKGRVLVQLKEGQTLEEAMKAYEGMSAEQLREAVGMLLDSTSSWEAKVGEGVCCTPCYGALP
jgi:hypothetical protein